MFSPEWLHTQMDVADATAQHGAKPGLSADDLASVQKAVSVWYARTAEMAHATWGHLHGASSPAGRQVAVQPVDEE